MKKIYLAMLLALPPQVIAAELDTADDTDLPEWAIENIAPIHDTLSEWVTNSSRSIDGFLEPKIVCM